MPTARDRYLALGVYSALVGLGGWGLFVSALAVPTLRPALWPLLLFTLLSIGVKRLGFRVTQEVTHSLVGVVDLAALLVLGPLGGGLVAACSGALCQVFCSLLPPRQPWPKIALLVPFTSGLNMLMAFGAARVYQLCGGVFPLPAVNESILLAVGVTALAWFALDHLGWTLYMLLGQGFRPTLRFLRAILPYSLLVELLPLPAAALISAAWLSFSAPLAELMMLAILGIGLVLRRMMVSLQVARQRAAQLEAIAAVSRKVAAILDLSTLFADTVTLVKDTFGYYHVSIFTTDAARQEMTFQASSDPLIQQRGVIVPWGQGILGRAASTGASQCANDVRRNAYFLPDRGLAQTRAEVVVPLKVEQRVLGLLDVQSDRVGAFGEGDLFTLETLGHQIAIAIEDSRLYEAQQEQTWVATALLQVAEAVGKLNAAEDILETVTRLTPLLTGVERCLILLWSATIGAFTVVNSAGLTPEQRRALAGQPLPEQVIPLLAQVRREGQPHQARSEDLYAYLPPPLARDPRRGTLLALPLRSKGEVIGILVAEDLDARRAPRPSRQTILTGIANYAAIALENARLYSAQREEAWVSTALLQVANTLSNSTSLDEIITSVVRLTPLLVGVAWCAMLRWDEQLGEFSVARAHGLPRPVLEDFQSGFYRPEDIPLLQRVMELGAPLTTPDAAREGYVSPAITRALGTHIFTALPLRVRERLSGVLLVGYAEGSPALSARRMGLLTGIANQAALALEAAQLYQQTVQQERLQHEIELARSIQASFMPECCPHLEGWQLAVEWRAARGVGGDYYDFIPLDAQRLGLVIADVSDKGVAAALYMALSRAVMHAAALSYPHSTAEALRHVNQVLMEDTRSGMFVSMFYAIVDLSTGRLSYARAGHNPPLLLRAHEKSVSMLAPAGMVLGVADDAGLIEETTTLAPGDVLLLYTDGVTEAINEHEEEFGLERLERITNSALGQSAGAQVSLVDAAVRVFTGERPQFDDFTLVVLKREEAR
jgi:serine phosphatase RsbU (regulator of sigma subunit)/putative methionine-R-sulfoxide reductase with GAF domain